jgi:phosphoribosylformylglycinamidine synthase I
MKSCVIVFPGSNCDRDAYTVLQSVASTGTAARTETRNLKPETHFVWHGDSELPACDLVVVPGGFSYGDYLRSGAMAAHSRIMHEVKKHADRGGYVLGICNGFQILTEAGLLPGVLMRNASLKFVCKEVYLRVENNQTPFTRRYLSGQTINVPIAHHDGNYFTDADGLKRLEENQQVAFRYVTKDGSPSADANPNGSLSNIAGVFNLKKNVLGMMPHPERHSEMLIGGLDGRPLFESLLEAA